ncbi:hypothetical protein ACNOYE_07425 [Nannocystaceae bacterium ST9]
MDVGTNQHGYRWLVEDQRTLGKGFAVRMWRDDEPSVTLGRSGFSTREGAVSWVGEFEGASEDDERRGLLIVAAFGLVFAATIAAALVRVFTGPTVVRIGGVRETTREIRIVGPDRSSRPGRARPG